MEHFISYKLLNLVKGDYYIDIASENSPFPNMFRKIGINAFSQDLKYPTGINKYKIGSSADELPIEDNSVEKISLQCAFEHFCENVDMNFIKELSRVLKPDGTCCIVPLYMASYHLNIVVPLHDYKMIKLDGEAQVFAEPNLGGIFEREYTPEKLRRRVIMKNIGLEYSLVLINISENYF